MEKDDEKRKNRNIAHNNKDDDYEDDVDEVNERMSIKPQAPSPPRGSSPSRSHISFTR